jgi:glycosyltransferase involved in cell wall biosynthesis
MRARHCDIRAFLLPRASPSGQEYERDLAEAEIPVATLRDPHPLAVSRMARELRKALEEFSPDVIQTHSYKATAVVSVLRAWDVRAPWIGFFHGATAENLKTRIYHSIDRALLRRADRVVVMSEHARVALFRQRPNVRVIHNAILSGSGARRRAPGLVDGPIGVIGRLSREKGVDVFLEALAVLHRRGRPCRAVIAGDGPERSALEARAHALGLAGHISFLGHVDDVETVYEQLSLLCIPSRSEGLPNVLLEAVLRDIRVVSTSVGAIPEIVANDAVALLVPPGEAVALAEALMRALEQPDDPAASACRRALVERMSVGARADRHVDLYDEVLVERDLMSHHHP